LARPHTGSDADRYRHLFLQFAVERRLGEKSTGCLQNLVGTAQLLDLTLHGFDAFTFISTEARADSLVNHRRKYKVTTNSDHKQPVFENKLNRQFDVAAPNQVYVGDITYIWTREGWLYLAVVIDLFSRKVVGWSMSSRMKARLVCDALRMAIWQRQPQAGLTVHSDRGSQYASREHRKLLEIYGFEGSMSRTGDCFDNAVAESFFGSLKQKRIHWRHYQTRSSAQQDVLQYISMFYNSHRLHSYLGYKSPNQYEVEIENVKKVAYSPGNKGMNFKRHI
jgi:putative transposase